MTNVLCTLEKEVHYLIKGGKKTNQTVILIETETAQLFQIPLKIKPEVGGFSW